MVLGNVFCKLLVGAVFDLGIDVQCVRGEHIWVGLWGGGGGGMGLGGYQLGVCGMRASQGTFSSFTKGAYYSSVMDIFITFPINLCESSLSYKCILAFEIKILPVK